VVSRRWLWLLVLSSGAVLAVAAWLALRRPPAPGRQEHARNLLLITIDTLRRDRVGVGLTPAIDALASRGPSFGGARAQSQDPRAERRVCHNRLT
jgi:hypothetical protein